MSFLNRPSMRSTRSTAASARTRRHVARLRAAQEDDIADELEASVGQDSNSRTSEQSQAESDQDHAVFSENESEIDELIDYDDVDIGEEEIPDSDFEVFEGELELEDPPDSGDDDTGSTVSGIEYFDVPSNTLIRVHRPIPTADSDSDIELLENERELNVQVGLVADSTSDEEEKDPEMKPPPRKKANNNVDAEQPGTSELESAAKDEDGYTCTICYESFTNSGEHRISCLKCGHVFGKSCIVKWLKQRGQCPQCNSKATQKDIRILYVKSLMAMDNTEFTAVKKELEQSQMTCSRYQFECTKMTMMVDSQRQQIQRLEQNVEQYKRQLQSNLQREPIASSSTHIPGFSAQAAPASATSGRKRLKLSLARVFDIKEGGCRVAAYSEWLNMLVVSHDMKNSLYPNGCAGVQKFNMLELRPSSSLPMHQKQIRDMEFSPNQHDVLLSVSLDKKAILFNGNSNVSIQSFQADCALWSCAWDLVQPNHFHVGTSNGQILTYDIRVPGAAFRSFRMALQDCSPICRIRFVPPGYRNDSSNVSGLLVQKLNSLWFCELVANDEPKIHQLPFEERVYVNVDFEPISRHFIVSTRASIKNATQTASHLVCDFRKYYSEPLQKNIVTSNLIHSYQGGNLEAQKMCRSMIFSPGEGSTYVCANGNKNVVKLWDISLPDGGNEFLTPVHDTVLDFTKIKVNHMNFVGLISDKRVSIYRSELK